MKRILAPHKEQDGWEYVRVKRTTMRRGRKRQPDTFSHHLPSEGFWTLGTWGAPIAYRDTKPWSRIISSRKVEEAVETLEYLRLCAEDGLFVWLDAAEWMWEVRGESDVACWQNGTTLREAYHRYKAACDAAK